MTEFEEKHELFLASIKADPGDRTRQLGFADWLQENGHEERAELVRVTMRIAEIEALLPKNPDDMTQDDVIRHDIRECCVQVRAELEARLSAWPCPGCGGKGYHGSRQHSSECFACGGSGDVLRRLANCGKCDGRGCQSCDRNGRIRPLFPLTFRAGYVVGCTVPTVGALVRECPNCRGETNLSRGQYCKGYGYIPTPRLRALAATPPWGVPLEWVRVEDATILGDIGMGFFIAYSPLPIPLVDILQKRPERFDTPDAAHLALGAALIAFGRGENP